MHIAVSTAGGLVVMLAVDLAMGRYDMSWIVPWRTVGLVICREARHGLQRWFSWRLP